MDELKTVYDLANYYKVKANEYEQKLVTVESHNRQYVETIHSLSAQIAELKSQTGENANEQISSQID